MQAVGALGFIAIIVGIIMLTISAIRKKGLRVWGIIAGVGLVAFIVGMSLSESSTPTQETSPTITSPPGQSLVSKPALQPTQKPPQLVIKDASEMVLTIADFEPGWVQKKAEPTTEESAQSAYYSYFYDGKSLPLSSPVIQNTIAVYPSIELAQQVYRDAVPKNVSLEKP